MVVLPIAHVNAVPFEEITGSFNLGVVGTHRIGLDGVVFRDGGGLTDKRRATTITKNLRTNNFEYWKAIDCAAFAAATGGDGLKTLSATVYPSIPGLTFLKQYAPRVLSIQLRVFAGAVTYPATVYVDPVGGSDANPGTSGSPFQTIKRAVEEITAVGAQNGGRILLRAGTYTEAVSPSGDCIQTPGPTGATTRYLHIEADTASGASKANITINQWPSPDGMRCTLLHLKNVKLSTSLAGIRTSGTLPTPRYCWLDDVDAQGTATSTVPTVDGWVSAGTNGFNNIYWTGGTISVCRRVQSRAQLLRNIAAGGVGECGLESNKCIINFAVLNVDPTGLASPNAEIYSIRNTTGENFLVWGLRAFGLKDTRGFALRKGTGATLLENVGLVNFFIEGDGSAFPSEISDPDTTWNVRHFVMEHATIVSQAFTIGNTVRAYSFDATVLHFFNNNVGLQFDSFDSPNQEWDHRGFDFMHYTNATSPAKTGRHVSGGDPLFNNPAADDYRPAAGSPLFLGTHKLYRPRVPHDAVQSLRGQDKTAIGAFRSLVEAPGGETAPSWTTPVAAYPPGPAAGSYILIKGAVMTPIAPVAPSGGAATKYRLLPSIDHAFRAPPEILADPDLAHFEVRAWKAGDPTKVGGAHGTFIVKDLRYGHIYLDHPKLQGQSFCPMAVAGNLSAPFAADAGSYTTTAGMWNIPDGPETTHGQRSLIRVDGDPTFAFSFGQSWAIGFADGYTGGIPGVAGATHVVSWSGVRGLGGGFHPLSGGADALKGNGRLVEFSVVGANLGKTDRCFLAIGSGIMSGGVADHSYDLGDVLFKQIQWGPVDGKGGAKILIGSKGDRSGRLRMYESIPYSAGPVLTQPTDPGGGTLQDGFILKWGLHTSVGTYWDVRRCILLAYKEHGLYFEGVGCGIFWGDIIPGMPPSSRNSYFIDNLQPTSSGRTMIQFAYRPGPCETGIYTPSGGTIGPDSFSNLPGPNGTSYFKGNRHYGPTESPTVFTCDGGAGASLIYDGNEVHMQGHRISIPAWYAPSGGALLPARNARGLLFWAICNNGAFFNDDGSLCAGIAVISHYDHVGESEEKRLTFRGAGPVRIYDMEFLRDPGFTAVKPAIEVDGADSGTISPATLFQAQFNKEGKWVFNASTTVPGGVLGPGSCVGWPIFGTPISNEGVLAPHVQDLHLLFNYPSPSASPIWGYMSNQKMVGWNQKKGQPPGNPKVSTSFSDADIDLYFKGRTLVDVLAASGIAFSTTTGTFSGTPTSTFVEGDIPFQHPKPGITRFYVEAANGAGTTVGQIDLFVFDTTDQFIELPLGEIVVEGPSPNIGLSIQLPVGEIVVEGLVPGGNTGPGGGAGGSGGTGSHGGPDMFVQLDTGVLELASGGDLATGAAVTIELPVGELVVEGNELGASIFGEGSEFGGSQGDVPPEGGADGIGL